MPDSDSSPRPNQSDDDKHAQVIESEQRWLDEAHAHLQAMQGRTARAVQASDRAVDQENTADARVAQWHMRRRAESLAVGAGPISFGRITEDGLTLTDPGDTWYVGRRHIEDSQGHPVVVDWRAPVSAPFYRATSVDPCGLVHRRRFSIEGQRLVAVFDEDLTDPDEGGAGGLPDPLLAELDRARSGQMRDIVSTIAAEQDIIIRAEREELLIVQGGPGTGKTAVGLHRAAYLLFRHRVEFADTKVLVVGPNRLFLRYIADVLPSLGETSVVQTTAPGLLGGKFPVRTTEEEAVAVVKGDARMVQVIDRFLSNRIKPPSDELEVHSGVTVIRFSPEQVAELQQRALERNLALNDAREVFRTLLIQESWRRYSLRQDSEPAGQPTFTGAIRGNAKFKKDVDRMWPAFSPPVIVRELYSSVRKLKAAAHDILTPEEMALLKRTPAKKVPEERWTDADMGVLDEAVARINGVPTSYGHVVVDEAQDQSYMSLRMLGRRASGHSMTILGDLAQATAPVAVGSWERTVEALCAGEPQTTVHIAELTVGYRVPASILEVANRLLVQAAPEVTPARSVRPGGAPPLVVRTDPGAKGQAVVAELRAIREADVQGDRSMSSIAVVGVDADLDQVEQSLQADAIAYDRVGRSGLPGADAIALVDPDRVKGLEFDAVIVVEPAAIAGTTHGLRRLYVSLTRPVQHLGLVHSDPLPELLGLD